MAEARQKEMKVNITVVATKTFIAGLDPSADVAILLRIARTSYELNPLKIAQRRASPNDVSGLGLTSLSAPRSTYSCGLRACRAAEYRRRAFRRGISGYRTSAPARSSPVRAIRGT